MSVAFQLNTSSTARRYKRRSFRAADSVYMEISAGSDEIEFVGFYPHSRAVQGQSAFNLEHNVYAEVW